MHQPQPWAKRFAAAGAILLFFAAALEVVIMISPFAFFFYAVFSPFFNFLGAHAGTRWAVHFFLPHMVLPPTLLLKVIRISGSVLFVLGCLSFIVCALQVYVGKIFRWGVASRGLYRVVRHPQYLSLTIWGIGMAILWPRFIVLVTLALMLVLYYFLARDEERRMLERHGESYRRYLEATGMFLPRAVEAPLARVVPRGPSRFFLIPLVVFALVLGAGFGLRALTLESLPLVSGENLVLVPILPEDQGLESQALAALAAGEATGALPFLRPDRQYLGYVMPADYIMQGMIADTGGHSHLFKQHHTAALIWDWVFHPFAHLRRPAAAHMAAMRQADPRLARRHHCPLGINQAGLDCDACPYRRVIFVEVEGRQGTPLKGSQLLGLDVSRTPVGFVDLNTQTGQVVDAKGVAKGSAWRDVPTPEI